MDLTKYKLNWFFGITLGILSFFYLTPLVHELGHLLVALFNHWTILQVQLQPALIGDSFVLVQTPLNVDLTAFFLAGTYLSMGIGFPLALIASYAKHGWIYLSLGPSLLVGCLIEALIGTDFAQVGFLWQIGTFCTVILMLMLTIGLYVKLRSVIMLNE
jgi:hypothetical protein